MKKAIPIIILIVIVLLESLTILLLVNHFRKRLNEEYQRGYKNGADIEREIIKNEMELNSIPAADYITMLGTEFKREFESGIDSLTDEIIRLVFEWLRGQSEGENYRVFTGTGEGSDDAASGGDSGTAAESEGPE